MTFRRSDQQRNTRYSQGGTVELSGNKIAWWERRVYEKSVNDVSVTISPRYSRRPDLLAYDLYGTPMLAWFILQYNTISDINAEFVEGAKFTLPTKSRLFGELLARTD